ncbi:centrosomal protein of 126 kDa isoform X2 [Anolis carolinensis]|uniref:centrosomal protein of 126 kDa isoform X2 n=1 Tax=Anolis carolinensis TaxID=28377 RepID=UPI002F2B73C3
MEPGGGGGGSGSDPSSGSERPAETWRRGREGEGLRKGLSESAVPRGLGRRAWAAFFPSSGPNLKVLLERDLSKERHELLKDQRLFHTQARKLSVETNKRRRALEEKWKEDEQKEQKFREQILLQRKQKHQEATERFQRSHLPSSQRKSGGGVQGKTEPKLDEALQKIQATGFFPFRVTERPSSATRNDPFNWKQNSPNVRCDRIMQENRRGNLNSGQLLFQQNLDEMQQQLQEQHFSNLQDFHQEVNEITRSESVSSVDSLEAGERNESCATLSETSSLSAQLDSSMHKSQGSQLRHKFFSDKTDTPFSKNQHVNNWLINLNTSNVQTTSPFRDILIKHNIVPSDEDASDWKSSGPNVSKQREAERCASDDNLAFTRNKRESKSFLLKRPSSGRVHAETPSVTETPFLKSNKAWAIHEPTPTSSVQEKKSELPQKPRASSTQASNQYALSISSLVFPATDWSTRNPHNNSRFINCAQRAKDAHAARCTEDTDCITAPKDEKDVEHFSEKDVEHIDEKDVEHVNTEETLLEEASEGSSDQQKSNGKEKVNENILFLPQGDLLVNLSDFDQQKTDHTGERKGVKFPKSILKKESKYEPGCFKAVVVNRGIKFGGQSVSDARDSIELAKIKGKDADIPKNNKKLRWFDEINRVVEGNDDEKCSEQSITEIFQPQVQSPGIQIKATASKTNIKSVPFYMLSSVFPETHQNSQISNQTTGGSNRDNVIQSNFGSSGYHVAKQAWMAPRGEEIRSALHNCDSKNPKNNPRKGRTKTIKRPKSAKSQSTTSVIKNRRGTIIRPQSASEAPKVMKAQGKIIVPHPPCKAIPDKGLDESPADVVYQSVSPCKLQTDTENSNFSNGRSFLPEGQDVSRNNTGDALPSTNAYRTHAATMRPSYSVFTYGPLTKTKVITNAAPSIVRSNSFPKRTPVYSENVLHLDRIPTDEEITVLWQGVHHALAQKDVTAGDSQHNSTNGDVPPTRPNVSHITIDGGILSGNIKSSFRSNASKPSTSVAFARRKQMNENNEYKRKALLEQRRQMTASARQKATGVGQNIAPVVKKVQSQLAYEPIQSNSNEVSDSTTQFLLAENLANLSATESEILSGLDVAQAHKQTVVLNRPPRQGMSALSFEEHQVLQSLDRLNQRLQNRIPLIHGPYTSYAKV